MVDSGAVCQTERKRKKNPVKLFYTSRYPSPFSMPSSDSSMKVRLFCCENVNCDKRLWFERVALDQSSQCRLCKQPVEASPNTIKTEWRQFKCKNVNCSQKGCLWWKLVFEKEENIQAVCKHCNHPSDAIPKGKEEGVGVGKFKCFKCGHRFSVVCEMTDTAPCYRCINDRHEQSHVSPYRLTPPRRVKKTTDNIHNCSKCDGKGDCGNMRLLHKVINGRR